MSGCAQLHHHVMMYAAEIEPVIRKKFFFQRKTMNSMKVEVVRSDRETILMIKRMESVTENGFNIVNFELEEAFCKICQGRVHVNDAVGCISNGRKRNIMHKLCSPADHEGDDECLLCGHEDCQTNDISCLSGRVCHHQNCKNNALFFFSIHINLYDARGRRIIGGGSVEADAILTCAKCAVYDVSVEMEKLLGADISNPLELLFGGYHQIIHDAYHCSPCYISCTL